MPDGSTAAGGDKAPAESPVLVSGLPLTAGEALTFAGTGWVKYTGGPSGPGPEGGTIYSHSGGAQNGISGITAPIDSLLGVFLTDAQPDATSAPVALDFSTALERDFTSLSPALQQVFFIGDGLTSGDVRQSFVVPTGATRFFLATMDGYGWYNNSGSFTVTVPASAPATVPIGPTGLLLATGIGLAGFFRRRA